MIPCGRSKGAGQRGGAKGRGNERDDGTEIRGTAKEHVDEV